MTQEVLMSLTHSRVLICKNININCWVFETRQYFNLISYWILGVAFYRDTISIDVNTASIFAFCFVTFAFDSFKLVALLEHIDAY